MKIQSLSIVVPAKRCVNDCAFCVSKMAPGDKYPNQIEQNKRFRHLYEQDYIRRLQFARNNGVNTIILTGDAEPLQNEQFLNYFSLWNKSINPPFEWIELQTTGWNITDEKLRWLRNTVGVTTISLSVSDLFDDKYNAEVIKFPNKQIINISKLCSEIKRYDFNLRISLNLIDLPFRRMFDSNQDLSIDDAITFYVDSLFKKLKELGANQLTLRIIFSDNNDELPQTKWIKKNARIFSDPQNFQIMKNYIIKNGTLLRRLPYGFLQYDVQGISVVIDDDCMSQNSGHHDIDELKYLILRPNCKLYFRWDSEASLLF